MQRIKLSSLLKIIDLPLLSGLTMRPTSNKPLVNSLFIFGLALGLASGQARAYDSVTGLTFDTTTSCGQMTDDIHRISSGQETIYENYINGFTDGINMSTYGKSNFFEGTDP
jgi:hypothetical protein